MEAFCGKSRRQRINQRNRTERLSDLLDWKRMGMEYVKARQLALRRAYPDSFAEGDEEPGYFDGTENVKISRPLSAPGSPRERSGMMTPGDFASLQEGREGLSTEDYIAWKLPEEVSKVVLGGDGGLVCVLTVFLQEEPEDYPFPLTLKQKNKAEGGSGTITPVTNGNGSA